MHTRPRNGANSFLESKRQASQPRVSPLCMGWMPFMAQLTHRERPWGRSRLHWQQHGTPRWFEKCQKGQRKKLMRVAFLGILLRYWTSDVTLVGRGFGKPLAKMSCSLATWARPWFGVSKKAPSKLQPHSNTTWVTAPHGVGKTARQLTSQNVSCERFFYHLLSSPSTRVR